MPNVKPSSILPERGNFNFYTLRRSPRMSSCLIDTFPAELLIQVLEYVQLPSSVVSFSKTVKPDSSIVSCLLCCKRWYEIALQVIYRDVVLQNHNLHLFTKKSPLHSHDALKNIRSLTITIDAKRMVATPEGVLLTQTDEEEHAKIHGLLLPLQQLPAILAQMTNLATFSLSITLFGQYEPYKDTINSILAALPPSCVNLELDLDRFKYNDKGTGYEHVCEGIADCLPRLHHLRLSMGTLCPALFLPNSARDGPPTHFYPPIYKSLKTFIINCHLWGDALTCNEDRSQQSNHPRDERARISLVKSLRELVVRGGFPHIERLWVLDGQNCNFLDSREMPAWNRRDIVHDQTWSMPWTYLHSKYMPFPLITRTPEDQEVITTSHTALSALIEGQTWKETVKGSRLPAALLDGPERNNHIVKGSPTISLAEYREISPKGSCSWWAEEKLTGERLIWPVKRVGLVDRSPVHKLTPSGWTREPDDEGFPGQLVRVNDRLS